MRKYFVSRKNITGQTTLKGTIDETKGGKIEVVSIGETREATQTDWENHFKGRVGLGLSPLLESNSCRWAAVDVDIYPFNIEDFSKRFSYLPIHFCRTKSGGLHIFLFFKRMQKSKEVREFLRQLCKLLVVPDKEFFPSSDKAKKQDGSKWINLPYFNGNETDRYCVNDGTRLTIEEFEKRVSENLLESFDDVLKHFQFAESPPCIQTMISDGVEEGNRNIALFNIAVFLKQKYKDDWQKRLFKFNYSLDVPIPDKELENTIIKQLSNKDVFYTCGQLAHICKRDICFTRQYGIGSKFSAEKIIGDLKKVTTDPPTWLLMVNEVEIEMTTDDLFNFNAIRKKIIEKLNIVVPRIGAVDWEKILSFKMETLVIIEAPEDAGQHSDFYYLLQKFCCDRCNAARIEEVFSEHVFIEKGLNYFLSSALMNYIKNKITTKYKSNNAYALLRKVGGESKVKSIKGKSTRLWTMPCYPEQKEEKEIKELPDWAKEEEF